MTSVIAIANHKGGVGKTTSALMLAHAAVADGRRVLVIDHDAQGGVALRILGDRDPDGHTLADIYARTPGVTLASATHTTRRPGLDIVPSGRGKLAAALQALGGVAPGKVLHKALEAVRDTYDLVIIDCDRGLSLGTINALYAADRVLLVTEPENDSFNGISDTGELVDEINEDLRPTRPLPDPDILINLRDTTRTATHGRVATEIREWADASGYRVHPHDIPRRAFIAEAAANGKGLDELRDIAAVTVRDSFHELLTTMTAERN